MSRGNGKMPRRDVKGIWIPIEVWEHPELSMVEKFLLAEVDSLDTGEGCYAKNKFFEQRLGVSLKTVERALQNLRQLNLLFDLNPAKKGRYLRSAFSRFADLDGEGYRHFVGSGYRHFVGSRYRHFVGTSSNIGENTLENTDEYSPVVPKGTGSMGKKASCFEELPELWRRVVKLCLSNPRFPRPEKEAAAWRKVCDRMREDDVALVEAFYRAPKSAAYDATWHRKSEPVTILRNWVEQVEHADEWRRKADVLRADEIPMGN